MLGRQSNRELEAGLRQRLTPYVIPVLVITVALLLRLSVTPWTDGRSPLGDPLNYSKIADNIMNGRGITSASAPNYAGNHAIFPPLYPMILACIGNIFPLNSITFAILHWLLDTATAACMLCMSRQLDLAKAGGAAAALYLLWPTNLLMSPVAQKESLLALFACVLIIMLLTAKSGQNTYVSILFGIVAGLTALTQPALTTLPALFALALLWRFQSRRIWLETIAIGVLAAAMVLTPWWIRNYAIFGEFVPLTSSLGASFWIGTMPNDSGDTWFPLSNHLLAQGNEIQISTAAMREATSWIAGHPTEFVRHTLSKVFSMLALDQWDAKPLGWMQPRFEPPLAFVAVPILASATLFALAAIGVIMIRRSAIRAIVFACLIQLFVFQIWFEFPERHRYFMVPILMIMAVEVARRLFSNLRRSNGAGQAIEPSSVAASNQVKRLHDAMLA